MVPPFTGGSFTPTIIECFYQPETTVFLVTAQRPKLKLFLWHCSSALGKKHKFIFSKKTNNFDFKVTQMEKILWHTHIVFFKITKYFLLQTKSPLGTRVFLSPVIFFGMADDNSTSRFHQSICKYLGTVLPSTDPLYASLCTALSVKPEDVSSGVDLLALFQQHAPKPVWNHLFFFSLFLIS